MSSVEDGSDVKAHEDTAVVVVATRLPCDALNQLKLHVSIQKEKSDTLALSWHNSYLILTVTTKKKEKERKQMGEVGAN